MQTAARDPAIAVILKRPFAEQVAFFRGKLGNLVPTATWRDVWQSAHDRAFMVAGAAKADLLADLAAAVDKAISEGETLEAFRKRFAEIVERHGWHGWTGEETPKGRAWRTRVIYQTNLATSYSAGRLAQLKAAGFKYYIYKHADAVANPRPQHLAWNGLTLPADHPFWRTHWPPNGWGCFPGDTLVRCSAFLGQRFFYSGEMVELHTRLGNRLAVTPNHPVLTDQGWVAAGLLKTGDQVIAAPLDIDAAASWIVDDEQPPSLAKNLFEALAAQGLRVVPMTPDDFYGDAAGGEGEVEIAGADAALMHELDAARFERIGDRPGATHEALAPVFGGSLGYPSGAHAFRSVSNRDTAKPKNTAQRVAAVSKLYRELLETHPAEVSADEIVLIRKYDWSGYVYDFSTTTGMIIAGGVIVSNCRCRAIGASGPETARLLGGDPDKDIPPGWDALDPKTGAPPGIDEGWGYQPGATVADQVRGLIPQFVDTPPAGRPILPPICPDSGAHARTDCPGPLPAPRPFDPGLMLPDGKPDAY